VEIGYTMMCEQSDPRSLVRDVVAAEEARFDHPVISDHFLLVAGRPGPFPLRPPGLIAEPGAPGARCHQA